jgi:hypothetical protein
MEQTRSQIRSTVEELKDRVNERLDWRHYVDRYPGSSLTAAVAMGVLLGRCVAAVTRRSGRAGDAPYAYGGYQTAERYGESGFTATAAEPSFPATRRALGQSASRIGSRAEGVVNRLIDELTDAVESTLLPALTSRFRRLIDVDRRGGWRHEGGHDAGSRRWDEPVREERSGIYSGGPAGSQHFPSQGPQGRTAEQP